MYLDVILIQEDAIVPFLVFVPAVVVFVVSVVVPVIVDIAMFVLGECRRRGCQSDRERGGAPDPRKEGADGSFVCCHFKYL